MLHLPTAETNSKPGHGTFVQEDEVVTWWQVDCIGPHPSWKRPCTWFLLEVTYSICFYFPYSQCFCQNHHLWTYVIWFTSRYSYSIAPDQGTHIISIEVQQWTCANEIYWSYHVLHHPEISAFCSLSFHAIWLATPCRLQIKSSRVWYMPWISDQYVVLFLVSLGSKVPGKPCENGSDFFHHCTQWANSYWSSA